MKDEKKRLKAVIYCRTSGKNQGLETDLELKKLEKDDKSGKISLQLQEKECRHFAEKNNYDVEDIYIDNNRSCITYPDTEYFRGRAKGDDSFKDAIRDIKKITDKTAFRTGLGEMVQRIAQKDIDIIIVRDETRLMRPLPRSGLLNDFLNVLVRCNTKIHTTQGKFIDPKNDDHIFVMLIVSFTEIKSMMNKIEASKASIKEKRDNGDVFGKLYCFGYEQEECNLIPVEEELKIVKEIFRQCLDGVPLCVIAQYLNKQKIPLYNGGKMWRSNNVRNILNRSTYAGYQKKSNLKEFIPINVLKNQKTVITYGEYLRVKEILSTHTRKSRATKNCHPLSGFLYCGECGSLMSISTSTNIRTKSYKFIYRCRSKKDQYFQGLKYECDTNITAYRDFDKEHPMFEFKSFKPNGLLECIQPLLAIEYLKQSNVGDSKTFDEILILQHKIKRIDDLEKELISLFKAGERTMDEFKSKFADSQNERTILKDKVNVLQNELAVQNSETKNTSRSAWTRKTKLTQGIIDRETAKQLIHKVIEKITVHKTQIEVKFKGIDKILSIPRMVYYCAFTLPFGKVKFGDDSNRVDVKYYLKTYYRKGDKAKKLVWSEGGLNVYFVGEPA